ncbi:MAG: penicillin-binding protein 2 [Acidobacteria bacterium]|nr:penicillin-binding protein 2 [Acidobacteriota bacterium]
MKQVKEPSFDPIEDLRKAGIRLEVLRYLAIGIFVILTGRLWYLQVMNTAAFAEKAEQNRTRILTIPARRGVIFDRKGRVLVTSQPSYNIVISRKDVKNFSELSDLLVANLDEIDKDWLSRRFEAAKFEAKYESIVVKEMATAADVSWVEAHQYEYPMIRAEEAPRRYYPYAIMAAHALGYVGEVDKKELNDPASPFNKEKGYKLGDIIGKSGIERTYNEILMGKDGERTVVVDSRGRIQREISRNEPVPGRDLYTTLDLDIQKMAEDQTDTMPAGRGVIVVSDPNNGEIFALVSHPAFNPNVFSLSSKTDEGKDKIRELYEDSDKPLFNRATQGTYPPGSTWKLMTSVAGLNEGVITPENSRIQDGGIQLGNYYMNSLSNYGMPDVVTSIARSADGYFYRLGLKMGAERFEKWVKIFRFGERTGVDLPREVSGTIPTRQVKENITRNIMKRRKTENGQPWTEQDDEAARKAAKWTEYDMAASAFGQGTNAATPIQLLRYVGGLAVGGRMYTPHLFLKAEPGTDREGKSHPEAKFEDRNQYQVPMNEAIHDIVRKGMWQAVNAGGTAGAAAVEGFDVCGKTGTAQVASNDKAGSKNKDHAWFMSFAPRDKPELAMVILTENAGFGGKQSAPRAKPIYEDYYRRTRGLPDPAAVVSAAADVNKQ